MKKKSLIKIISFILIIFSIFQLIPNSVNVIDDLQTQSQNTKVFMSFAVTHHDALLVGRDTHNNYYHKVQQNNISLIIPQVSVEGMYTFQPSFQAIDFDYRRIIRQSIPHYYNGSKYKSDNLAI